jgi:phosphoesterase RecJ-like protein
MMQRSQSLDLSLLNAKQFIEGHDDFLVVSHINPDGDAASSTCAMGWLLKKLGKRFVMANIDSMPARFSYLTGIDSICSLEQLQDSPKFRTIISVDCADYYRFGELHNCFTSDARMLNIDHHATNGMFGQANLVDVTAAATAQVIYSLLEYMNIELDQEVAKCLYTGLLTDTGGFRYQNTTPRVLEIASILLSHGVSPTEIARISLECITPSHVAMLQRALTSLSFNENGKISWVVATSNDLKETGATADDLDGIVRYPVNISGVEVGLLFKQLAAQTFKVSLRSNDVVNVSKVASLFGGGGHIRAAGCTVQGELDEVIQQVVGACEQAMQ